MIRGGKENWNSIHTALALEHLGSSRWVLATQWGNRAHQHYDTVLPRSRLRTAGERITALVSCQKPSSTSLTPGAKRGFFPSQLPGSGAAVRAADSEQQSSSQRRLLLTTYEGPSSSPQVRRKHHLADTFRVRYVCLRFPFCTIDLKGGIVKIRHVLGFGCPDKFLRYLNQRHARSSTTPNSIRSSTNEM